MKKIVLFLLMLTQLLCVSCAPRYTTEIPMEDLCEAALLSLDPNTSFVQAEKGFLDGYFQTPDSVFEHRIYYATDGNNLDEFGIFYTTEPKRLEELLDNYLDDCLAENESFYNSYIPEQTPKLRDAEVEVYGNCVAYAILSKQDEKAFFRVIEETLRV